MRGTFFLLLVLGVASSVGCGPTSDSELTYWIDDGGAYHRNDGASGDAAPTHCDPGYNPADCDTDADGYSPNQGDCNDQDPSTHPGAGECNTNGNGDGKDNNCNQRIDEGCLDTDEDDDGYTIGMGDCDDQEPLVAPGSYEVAGNSKDDNCDGRVDEVINCDCGVTLSPSDPQSYVNAFELCASLFATPAVINGDPRAFTILQSFGLYQPKNSASCNMIAMSTGIAGSTAPQTGTDLGVDWPTNPANDSAWNPNYAVEPPEVYDYAEFKMSLQAPTNAQSFAFDFVYLTSEYPEYSCTSYNDTFLALLKSQAYPGGTNISFDANHNTIQVNSALFVEVLSSQLTGTGYDVSNDSCEPYGDRPGCTLPVVSTPCVTGGSTGWLTTTSPVAPGEIIDLTFSIFDEGDHILDSMVLLDNFRWEVTGSSAPCTDPDGC